MVRVACGPILCTTGGCDSRLNGNRCVLGRGERRGVGRRTHLPELRRCQIPQRTVGPDVVVRTASANPCLPLRASKLAPRTPRRLTTRPCTLAA